MTKQKIIAESQPCRKCGGKLVRKEHDANFKPDPTRPYYFAWWLQCSNCKTPYLVERAKVFTNQRTGCECMGGSL